MSIIKLKSMTGKRLDSQYSSILFPASLLSLPRIIASQALPMPAASSPLCLLAIISVSYFYATCCFYNNPKMGEKGKFILGLHSIFHSWMSMYWYTFLKVIEKYYYLVVTLRLFLVNPKLLPHPSLAEWFAIWGRSNQRTEMGLQLCRSFAWIELGDTSNAHIIAMKF